jgi:hypothetical protein
MQLREELALVTMAKNYGSSAARSSFPRKKISFRNFGFSKILIRAQELLGS